MVMDRPLSPQCVGREFVRQYYTLLNEAPEHLHRFYNNSSSFIHGGVDSSNRETVAVVGQRQIHQRIQQLNFRDCHAKITQVDSQATLGNGVVVQVSGELSNAGQPMRRFSQTFVLASQNPKKYYVHNDIFRYQDMLTDEDVESELARSEAEEDQEPDGPENEIHQAEGQTNVGYYTGVSQVVNGTGEPKVVPEETVVQPTIPIVQQQQQPQQQPPAAQPQNPQQQPQQAPQQSAPQPTTQVPTESIHPQQYNSSNNIDVTQPQIPPQEGAQPVNQNASYVVVDMKPNQLDQDSTQQYHNQVPSQQPVVHQQSPQQPHIESVNEPKTYATLVKSGTQVSGTVYYNSSPASQQVQPPQPPVSPPPAKSEKPVGMIKAQNQTPKPQRGSDQRNNFSSANRSQNSDDNGNYGGGSDDRRRNIPNIQYSDSHQLFIGNLPHNATEMDLRDLFGKFGTIVDLRILSKPGSKGPGLRVPNYGFIIFEDVSSVQSTLNAKPIYFPDENGVKLNVEEKKARREGGGGGGGPRGSGGSRGGGPGGMMRGGPGGMAGPPRGGGTGSRGGIRFNPNNRGR
ncbi:hypothetical protein O3M35_007361 [Rhynocoris fuscipes]|uniref:Uncharacterized protein n=1 Tax=Rhynocoris fuscipes TaxID=488301 RepID=A0AAW1D9B5_9HEMI